MTIATSSNDTIKPSRKYHHGDLAEALITATVALLAVKGPAQLSLREVARAAGVSHGAPAHHFGDKAGLLTAVATAGHNLLADQLHASQAQDLAAQPRLVAAGDAYIRFAVAQPAYFSVMFQPDVINSQDADYVRAGGRSRAVLEQCIAALADGSDGVNHGQQAAKNHARVVALWSLVHGFACLWLTGNFGDPADMDLLQTLLDELLGGVYLN